MKYYIKHEIQGRIRVHMAQKRMSCREADILLYYIQNLPGVTSAKVYEKTADAWIVYEGERGRLLASLRKYHAEDVKIPDGLLDHSGRELNARYQDKLAGKILARAARQLFLPAPLNMAYTAACSAHYLWKGARCVRHGRLDVEVLDAAAIGASIVRGDFKTASSVIFLLGVGEILEECTHKKSVDDLARSMSLNISKVWMKRGEQEVLVKAASVHPGDEVVVHMGNVIPFDGIVTAGEAMVNQASLTGESLPVRKIPDKYVYAGTVLEEGELTIQVQAVSGSTKYEKIVKMIEDSEKLKSAVEGKASRLADRLVPYTFMGALFTWLLTRNVTKAMSVLMVDFSCALKLSIPIAVLSAIRESSGRHITVKGGKYLEALAEATTVVFDKTGTLTKAKPTVKDVIVFAEGGDADEMLRTAACLEEHFPHSMANAVVAAAKKRGLEHEEMHSKVEYIVAHGISSSIGEKKVVIGSYHFVFEDEGCTVDPAYEEDFRSLPAEYSHLYMAIDQKLAAVICIEDPLREEAADVVQALRESGIRKIVMMTGDSERTAAAIAQKIRVDEYYSEVLPEDKADYIEQKKAAGEKVIMIGDGINDSPALSAANVGIAISDGAEIAREVADITIEAENLYELVTLLELSKRLMGRIDRDYKAIVGINSGLILLGAAGILQPAASALLHNASTVAISLKNMQNLL